MGRRLCVGVIVAVLVLVACGGGDSGTSTGSVTATTTPTTLSATATTGATATTATSSSVSTTTTTSRTTFHANEAYGSSDGAEQGSLISTIRQSLDIYLPSEGEGPYPTILAFHGGGFVSRSKSLYEPYAGHFTDQGFAVVPSNYRLLPDSYPAQVEDAFCALAWIHAKASVYGFDTDRIFVMGDSAGGYLAAMVGTVDTPELYQGDCPHPIPAPNSPRGVVVLYGFFDLTTLEALTGPGRIGAFMGGRVDELPQERLAEMSPMSWIDGNEPSFLLIHGTEDRTTQSWASEQFADALKKAGVDATLLLVEEDHAFLLDRTSPSVEASLEVIDEFLADLLP